MSILHLTNEGFFPWKSISKYLASLQLTATTWSRALAIILYLSAPVDNQNLIFINEGVSNFIVKVMRDIFGETRFNSCSALEFMEKTPENIATTVKYSKLIVLVDLVVKWKGDDNKIEKNSANMFDILTNNGSMQERRISYMDWTEQSIEKWLVTIKPIKTMN